MNKELQEFEASIKKERSKFLKERRQQMYDRCSEVYESITITELRLIWYLRQFKEVTPQHCMETAKFVYRAKCNLEKSIEEERKIGVDKPLT